VDAKAYFNLAGIPTLGTQIGLNGQKDFQFVNPNGNRTCGCWESFLSVLISTLRTLSKDGSKSCLFFMAFPRKGYIQYWFYRERHKGLRERIHERVLTSQMLILQEIWKLIYSKNSIIGYFQF